jgi:hypothetical protein
VVADLISNKSSSEIDDRRMESMDDSLFDDSSGYEDDKGIQLTPGLSEHERRQATALYRLFNELWGLCVIRGEPGAGKDTFLNWLLYTLKRYFPGKRILRDEKPRALFGPYAGLFNEERIQEDLKRMREVAKGSGKQSAGDVNYLNALEKAAEEWVGGDGAKVMLQHSVVGLTEYWKYVYNREPHNPMNKTMGGIHKMGRHLDTLIAGCVQLETDLDKKTCKPFINWRVTCTRSVRDSTRYTYIVQRVKYDQRLDLLVPISRIPTTIPVDAGKPRSFIGDGRIIIRKPNYQPETEEERIVWDAIRAGLDRYDDLVEFLEDEGDMSEFETLATLKGLCLKLPNQKPKFAIWYPCYYFIFNSRSAPSMKSNIKAG